MKAICNYFLTKVTGLSLSLLFGIAANAQCPNNNERIYATSDNWHSLGGFLSNGINSFDQNPSTAAEITTVVGALGLGGGYYDLFFDQTLTAGTPVTIKVGKQYSGLSTVSSFLVYGLNSSGNPIGVGEPVNPGLLSLLSADSAFEFTFIPQNGSGNQPFSGVRVYLGSLLSVADTFKIYEVYVKQQSATANCTSFQFDDYDDDNDGIDDLLDGIQPTDPYVRKDVMDLHYGVQVLAGLNALSATASVVHPWQAVDSDVVNYAILNRGVAVLNSAQIKVDFKAQSIIGDQIEILLSRPDNNILQLGLINGFQINLYNNGVHVMGPITNLDPMLNLELLNLVNTTDEVASLTLTPPMVFDQVTISYGGVANVLDAIKVHEVSKKPVIETVLVPNGTGEIDMCSTNQLSFQIQDNCTNYIVYDSAMNPLNTSNNYDFDLPIGITEGDYIFYVQAVRQGCEIGLLQEVAVHINQNAVDTDIADVLLNGNITPVDVCLANNPQVILTTQLSGISTITNPTFHWYDENGNPITGGSNGTLDLGTLSPGTYTYGVAVEGDQVCLNLTPKTITFTIQDENTPTTSNSTQQFCTGNNPTVADLQTNESPIVWYDALTGGNVVTSSTALVDGEIYYAAYQGATCESSSRLAITVTLTDEPTPTTTNTTQQFCAGNNPRVADLQTNESPIVWYDALTGGNVLNSTTALVDGAIYYAAYQGTICESSSRLAITVSLTDEPAPTTSNTTQQFCAVNNPTVADLQTNESPIVWYDALTGGNVLNSTTALVDGAIYYAAYQGTICESSSRLAITVSLTDEPAPTTSNTTQQFCAVNNPTVADLQTNESPIVWYDALTGGNVVTSTTALVDGAIYYAAYQGTTCESSSRLAITVTLLNNAIANLNGPSGNACYRASDANSVYTTDASMTNYQWVVTGGIIINGGGTNDDFVEVNWNTLPSGNVSVSYDSASICGGSASQSFDVQIVPCSNLNITKTADHDEVAVGDTVVFTITVYNSGTSNVTDVNVSENLPSGYTYVSHTTSTGTYDVNTGIWNIPTLDANTSETLMVTVTVNADGDYVNMAEIIGDPVDTDPDDNVVLAEVSVVCLTVYNEFSPNNDGENDYFIIDCIENYPNNKIEIFNRYGNVVYQTSSYDNSWTGVANVSGVVGKGEYLPNGTYYYVLKIEELNYSKTGWLYLAR